MKTKLVILAVLTILVIGCKKETLPERNPYLGEWQEIELNKEYQAIYDTQVKVAGYGDYKLFINNKVVKDEYCTGQYFSDYVIFKGDTYKLETSGTFRFFFMERE